MPVEIGMGRMIVLFEYPPKSNTYQQLAFDKEQATAVYMAVLNAYGWDKNYKGTGKVSGFIRYKQKHTLPEDIQEYYEIPEY